MLYVDNPSMIGILYKLHFLFPYPTPTLKPNLWHKTFCYLSAPIALWAVRQYSVPPSLTSLPDITQLFSKKQCPQKHKDFEYWHLCENVLSLEGRVHLNHRHVCFIVLSSISCWPLLLLYQVNPRQHTYSGKQNYWHPW